MKELSIDVCQFKSGGFVIYNNHRPFLLRPCMTLTEELIDHATAKLPRIHDNVFHHRPGEPVDTLLSMNFRYMDGEWRCWYYGFLQQDINRVLEWRPMSEMKEFITTLMVDLELEIITRILKKEAA